MQLTVLARLHDSRDPGRPVERAVRRAARGRRLVLAVSGGRDSMAMLHAHARVVPESVAMVATFDHGTGPAATRAAGLVAGEAARLGLPCVVGRGRPGGRSEADLRAARFAFLDDVARRCGGVIATAHTRDDQVETVVMRVLRDAGARGLAGLYARAGRVRPLLDVSRTDVAAYAAEVGARWIEDPTNQSLRYLRNRVRRDLLPALKRASPGLESDVLALARDAAAWRERLDAVLDASVPGSVHGDRVVVEAGRLIALTDDELRIVWPALAARIGLALDWRGTERAAAFTHSARVGARATLSGGWTLCRLRDGFELSRGWAAAPKSVPLRDGAALHGWVFRRASHERHSADAWTAWLPAHATLRVRAWQPGDRLRARPDAPARRVKRYLTDARVSGMDRARWPVVLVGDDIVWIPGIRRTDAAASAGANALLFRCDRDG